MVFRVNASQRRNRFKARVLFLALCVSLCGLQVRCGPPSEYVKFRELPKEKQICEFRKFPVEKQIEYYLYGRDLEPPDLSFAIYIASRGKEVIPILLDRLRKEPAEYRQEAILNILEVMSIYYVDLRQEEGVLASIQDVIERLKDPHWKRMAQKSLDFIKGRSGGLKAAPPLRSCES